MNKINWHGLYADSWGNDLVPEAYAHPAKYSRGLIRQIYAHMLAEGMIAPGDVIGDPFGGQAGGALDAMLNGLHWRGVELEPRFVDLGNQNIELWNGRYAPHMRRWGTAVLMQGDSRSFAGIVGGVDGVVSSPPYVDAVNTKDNGIDYSKTKRDGDVTHQRHGMTDHDFAYGKQPGQLGSMPTGDLAAVISSPPYADTIENGDGPGARWDADGHPGNPDKVSSAASYGDSAGQLGRLGAVVTSPPFEAVTGHNGGKEHLPVIGNFGLEYGSTPGNIGNDTGNTFWSASRAIVEQVYLALKPGGYAAFVTGDFVRKDQRVRFGEQWLALCEACGFTAVTWAVAWKTEHHGTQLDIFGNASTRMVDRVSFFRQLANAQSHAAEHWRTLGKMAQAAYIADMTSALDKEYAEIMAGMEPPTLPTWNVTIEQVRQFEADKKRYDRIMEARKTAAPPTAQKVLRYAKMAAWIEADGPRLSDAAVLNEDVIFVRKGTA